MIRYMFRKHGYHKNTEPEELEQIIGTLQGREAQKQTEIMMNYISSKNLLAKE